MVTRRSAGAPRLRHLIRSVTIARTCRAAFAVWRHEVSRPGVGAIGSLGFVAEVHPEQGDVVMVDGARQVNPWRKVSCCAAVRQVTARPAMVPVVVQPTG